MYLLQTLIVCIKGSLVLHWNEKNIHVKFCTLFGQLNDLWYD